MKNPGVAAVLSFFYTGLGQIYNGQILKGLFLMLIQVVNILLMWVLVGFFTYAIVWLYGMFDAYHTAARQQSGFSRYG